MIRFTFYFSSRAKHPKAGWCFLRLKNALKKRKSFNDSIAGPKYCPLVATHLERKLRGLV
jgi:hypothetical protein